MSDMTPSREPEVLPSAPESPGHRKRIPPWALGAAGGLMVGVLLGGFVASNVLSTKQETTASAFASASASASASAEKARLKTFVSATRACGSPDGAEVSDGGRTLTVDSKGDDDFSGITDSQLWCLIGAVKAPQSAISHMEQTTSLDGRQSEEWRDIEVQWSYHPNRGMDAVFTLTE